MNSSPQALEPEHAAVGATPLALDRFYVALADALAAETPARFTALRLQGLDIVGHYFLRYAMPQAFGDVSEEERGRFGRVFEQYYAYVDAELGRLLDRLQPGDLLLVVSPFGLEPLSLPKRLLERTIGNPNISGTHERAPDGFLLAYGTAVKPGRYPARVGGRRHADPALLLRPANWPRHGRLRTHRHLHDGLLGRAADSVHTDVREVSLRIAQPCWTHGAGARPCAPDQGRVIYFRAL